MEVDVLVVGAGPTGLLLGAELWRRQVTSLVVDANPEPMHWDRATVIHPGSLEVFDSLGLVDRFLEEGVPQRAVRIHSDGALLGELDLAASGSTYGYNLGLSEEVTESILTDHLRGQGGDVTRGARLVGVDQHDEGVVAEIEQGGEVGTVAARWLVGCDGFHSATRDLVGIGFTGTDIAAPWAVLDATCKGWSGAFDVTYAYLDATPVILTALPGRRWRIYLRPSSPGAELVADATRTIARYQPQVQLEDVENPTRFHCHTKVAARFRAGPVLLAGDAAHVCSPAQGHGMNSGLQDAVNLAWKLALVCRGDADTALLDTYETERRPVAVTIGDSGDQAEAAQAASTPADRRARDRAMAAVLADPKARHHEVVAEVELDVAYADSPIVDGDPARASAPGTRLPDGPAVDADGGPTSLRRLAVHQDHTVVVVGGPRGGDIEPGRLAAGLHQWVAGSAVFDTVVPVTVQPGGSPTVARLAHELAGQLDVAETTVLAVRPDGFIGLRATADHAAALGRYDALVRAGGR